MPYDPLKDSNDVGLRSLVLKPSLAAGPLIVIKKGECWCGCHERPLRNRRFKPGHDTRFRGVLQRAHGADVPVTLIVGAKRHEHPADWWWTALELRKESEAVRDRDDRRAGMKVADIERTLAAFDPLDPASCDAVTVARAEAERLAAREQRRLKLG